MTTTPIGRPHQRWRRFVQRGIAVILLLVVSGCGAGGQPTNSSAPGSPSAPASASSPATSASSSLPAGHDLFTPGLAQSVVAQLIEAAGNRPVVRVVLNRTQARLTYVAAGQRPGSVVWQAGQITASDDGTDLVAAVSFDPNRFNLSDVATIFAAAAQIAGSDQKQELQINEYDHGQVLMTVTTSPESSTVFFDRAANAIPRLKLSSEADLAIGIGDVLANRLLVVAVGINATDQVWADLIASPGVLERRIRPANLPMYRSQRREEPRGEQFDVSLVDPAVLGLLLRTGPGLLDKPADAAVAITVSQPIGAASPQILVEVGGAQLITDLSGKPITE